MSISARSVLVFGLYMTILGVVLVIAPNFLLTLFAVPTTAEVWIRVAGMLVLFLAIYYIVAALNEIRVLFNLSIYLRSSVILFFIVFVLLGFVQPQLLLFGVIDLLGAVWTAVAMRSTKPSFSSTV